MLPLIFFWGPRLPTTPLRRHHLWMVPKRHNGYGQKYSRLRCLLRVKGLVICFHLVWSGSILQFRQNVIKITSVTIKRTLGSKSWLLTCSSNITLSLPLYTGSALKRELKKLMAILLCCIFAYRSWYK